MSNKAVVTLATGMEDPEKVTVALLVAVGAAEGGRDTLMWLAKEGVRLAVPGVAVGMSCSGCPPIAVPMWEWIGDDGATTFSF